MTKKEQAVLIWEEAKAAAEAAAQAAVPTPILVGSPTTPLGSDIDFTRQVWHVPQGLCGFAWVTIKPARGALVTLLKSLGIGYKGYYGGWQISAFDLSATAGATQSVEIKEAAVRAAAKVLSEHGVTCSSSSRLD